MVPRPRVTSLTNVPPGREITGDLASRNSLLVVVGNGDARDGRRRFIRRAWRSVGCGGGRLGKRGRGRWQWHRRHRRSGGRDRRQRGWNRRDRRRRCGNRRRRRRYGRDCGRWRGCGRNRGRCRRRLRERWRRGRTRRRGRRTRRRWRHGRRDDLRPAHHRAHRHADRQRLEVPAQGRERRVSAATFDDSTLERRSTLPHTWNASDGQDGGNNYYRGIGWYRRHYTLPAERGGQARLPPVRRRQHRRRRVRERHAARARTAAGSPRFRFDVTADADASGRQRHRGEGEQRSGDRRAAADGGLHVLRRPVPRRARVDHRRGSRRHARLSRSSGVYVDTTTVSAASPRSRTGVRVQNDQARGASR